MELQQLEADAKLAALRDVKNMLQRPGQLEKVDQYKHRVSRKKASVEAQLKTAMQSQLDGVKEGLKHLERSVHEIRDVDVKIKDVGQLLTNVLPIYNALSNVREENTNHSQYVTAMENLKHIFTVQSSVTKTLQWIEEDKLLHAHQCLTDLENSRDDLLFELHKLPKQYAHDKITLKRYFEKVDEVSQKLERKIRLIMNRTLATVRKEPTIIVTALRLIEREEKADHFALLQQKQTGFLPPGRPKEWRRKTLEVLKTAVVERIEGSKLDERADNKLWLVRDLEIARQFTLEDLRVVRSLCSPCFPPHYDIFNEYVRMYHETIATYLEEIVQGGLEENEHFSLLSWVTKTYPSKELMSHDDLRVDLSIVGPLLRPELLCQLETEYLQNLESNYIEWMQNTLKMEKEDWLNDTMSNCDENEQYYHTSTPVIIFQMIHQNLQVSAEITAELTFKVLILSIRQLTNYGTMYRQAIIDFKEQHFRDRSRKRYFTQHIITIVNNCQHIIELAQQEKQLYWPKSRTEHYQEFETLLSTFQLLRNDVAAFLLEEAFLDLEVHFSELFTPKWAASKSTKSVDTICATLDDYFHDYNHLRDSNFKYVITAGQTLVTVRYIKALLSKRISKPRSECEAIASKAAVEARLIKHFFGKVAPNLSELDTPVDLITTLANLLKCDIEMLVLDLHTLLGNYPSLTEDHLVRLFHMRNDIKAAEVRERIQDAIKSKKAQVSTDKRDAIFREIVFADRLW